MVMGKDQSSRQTSDPDNTGEEDTSREGISRRSARPPPPPPDDDDDEDVLFVLVFLKCTRCEMSIFWNWYRQVVLELFGMLLSFYTCVSKADANKTWRREIERDR